MLLHAHQNIFKVLAEMYRDSEITGGNVNWYNSFENNLELSDKFKDTHPVRAVKCSTASSLEAKP